MHGPFHRQVGGASHQAVGDEGIINRYDQQGNDVENEEGGHGVDLGMQFPSMGVRGAGDEALISGWDVEGVKVGEHCLWNSQDQ